MGVRVEVGDPDGVEGVGVTVGLLGSPGRCCSRGTVLTGDGIDPGSTLLRLPILEDTRPTLTLAPLGTR